MKKISLIAALFVALTMNAQIFFDGFEDYDDFSISNIGDWTQIDVDGNFTYTLLAFSFDNEEYVGTGMVFNPSQAPSVADDGTSAADNAAFTARTGNKCLYFFAATNSPNGTAENDDYFISPQISLTNVTDATLSFWAKSLTENFGAERLEVLLSTTGTDVDDFTENLSNGVITVTEGDYQELTYDLSDYEGEEVFIAIHYVAQDSLVLQIDDFTVEGTTLGINDLSAVGFNYTVKNNTIELRADAPLESLNIFNILGQSVRSVVLSSNQEIINIDVLPSGIYLAQATVQGITESFKIIKR